MSKIHTFNETQAFLSKIEQINRGGCGFSALALYDAAVKENLNPKIIYLYTQMSLAFSNAYENNELVITENLKDRADACSHIVVEINKQWYDCKGVVNDDGVQKYHEVSREHLLNSIRYGNWNDDFNRKKYLPKINEFIGYDLLN